MGGAIMTRVAWMSLAWAICLMISLDFQVLALGARAHKVYLSDKKWKRKAGEIALAVIIAAGISYVSIQDAEHHSTLEFRSWAVYCRGDCAAGH